VTGPRGAHGEAAPGRPPFSITPGVDQDLRFLRAMLHEAAFWRPGAGGAARPSLDEALASPHLARYVEGWGRPGDRALLARHGDRALGAVWYRLFTADRPGYGFVDAATPELSIGVLATERGRGVGAALLAAALAQAALDGHPGLSLSVEPDNPALRLYERLGFVRRELADGAWVMILTLS
jgi:ribosomal protein S18 acetylase RimI-like enzyme